jgi:hypothetical protein
LEIAQILSALFELRTLREASYKNALCGFRNFPLFIPTLLVCDTLRER